MDRTSCILDFDVHSSQPEPNARWRHFAVGLGFMSLPKVLRVWLPILVVLCGVAAPGTSSAQVASRTSARVASPARSGLLMDVHAALGVVAVTSFSTSLVIGAASGNLGKLMDAEACCPNGGTRDPVWRTTDRALVTTGIVAYSAAAAIALYNLLVQDPVSQRPRHAHQAHRWLALAHGAAFLTSAVTGIIMMRSQESNPERFAATARIHTASNLVLVPVLSVALSDIIFE